jgi:hypothetical protein
VERLDGYGRGGAARAAMVRDARAMPALLTMRAERFKITASGWVTSYDLIALAPRIPSEVQRWLTGSSLLTIRFSLIAEHRSSRSRP